MTRLKVTGMMLVEPNIPLSDTHTNLDSLRKMGLNPDDYTEVKIKK